MSLDPNPARLPHRLALLTVLCAVPLVLFGGSVTTLGAGMAVEGWLVAEGHFLLFFPVEKWFRDTATFVEHTHRLFGVLVGLASVATVFAAWRSRLSRRAKFASILGLILICAQGALGGFRVLESSPELAFVHGAFAQAVFAYLCVLVLVLSPRWQREEGKRSGELPAGLSLLAWVTPVVVYAQIVIGAWYRHSLRPTPTIDSSTRLAFHLVGAFVALAFVAALALSLLRHQKLVPLAARSAKRIGIILGLQVFLGLTAWVGFRPEVVGPLEWAVSILHVLGGALLLAECSRACLATLSSRSSAVSTSPKRSEIQMEGVR